MRQYLGNRSSGATFQHILFANIFILMFSINLAAEMIWEIVPKSDDTYEVKDSKVYLRRGNTGMILEVADPQSIPKYYSDRGIQLGNPFVGLGGESQDSVIFSLTFVNRSKGAITFNSRYVTLKIGERFYFAMDYAVLLEFSGPMDQVKQKVLEKSVFHSSEVISADEVVTKFLVFPGLPTKFGDFRLEFDFLYFENKETKVTFHFTRKKSGGTGT